MNFRLAARITGFAGFVLKTGRRSPFFVGSPTGTLLRTNERDFDHINCGILFSKAGQVAQKPNADSLLFSQHGNKGLLPREEPPRRLGGFRKKI